MCLSVARQQTPPITVVGQKCWLAGERKNHQDHVGKSEVTVGERKPGGEKAHGGEELKNLATKCNSSPLGPREVNVWGVGRYSKEKTPETHLHADP